MMRPTTTPARRSVRRWNRRRCRPAVTFIAGFDDSGDGTPTRDPPTPVPVSPEPTESWQGQRAISNRHGSCGVRMATEVEMRKWYIPLVLLLVGVAWWASQERLLKNRSSSRLLGLGIGEHVTLSPSNRLWRFGRPLCNARSSVAEVEFSGAPRQGPRTPSS